MTDKIKPGVKTAVAFAHITGRLPKAIHMATWMDARKFLNDACSIDKRATAEALPLIADHPFIIGHAYMQSRGFAPVPYQKGTSHYIRYRNDDGIEAGLGREGSVWIWWKHDTKPGSRQENINSADVKKAVDELPATCEKGTSTTE